MHTRFSIIRIFVFGFLLCGALTLAVFDARAQEVVNSLDEIDLIIEADTSVPVTYPGRALPTFGSPVRVVAIPHIVDGNRLPTVSDYTYKWSLNNRVLFGGPIKGQYFAHITLPETGESLLSVAVVNSAGQEVLSKTRRIRVESPEVYFYEQNPLRGKSRKAIGDTYTLTGDEVTFAAEPYFVNTDLRTSGAYTWSLDGQEVAPNPDNPSEITVRTSGGSGTAKLFFEVRNTQALLQSVSDGFNIFFQ